MRNLIHLGFSQKISLWVVAIVNGLFSAIYVLSLKDLSWHPARDAELRSTYDAFIETGILLIKRAGAGSYGAQSPGSGEFVLAAWDDDPGSFVLASWLGLLTHSDSPYPGLRIFLACLVFLTGALLPFLVFRIFNNVVAGYAVICIPFLNQVITGSPLIGTQYGKSDAISTLPAYALYGIAGELVLLGLILVIWVFTLRAKFKLLIFFSFFLTFFAATANLFRANSGIPIAIAIGILWALRIPRKRAVIFGILISVIAIASTFGIQKALMIPVNDPRAELTGQSSTKLPDSHNTWHALYLGLSWPQPITNQDSDFKIIWSDEFAWSKAKEVDPDTTIASSEYDSIMKDLYLKEVTSHPFKALQLYLEKTVHSLLKFSAEIIAIVILGLIAFSIGARREINAILNSFWLIFPALVWGLFPAILVMPMLYFYNEITAGFGLLVAIVWSGLANAVSSNFRKEST